ncbi:MAG TPA: hypothetical protein VJG32_20640 [Anaerolineae bacterium]|nr:hypothetical protein [Anaerolineae bacterium]
MRRWPCGRSAFAGATWWIEYLPPDEYQGMRACIERGPLRIE